VRFKSNLKAETVKAIVANLAHREKGVRQVSMQRHQERLAGVESAVTPTAKALANETIVLMPFYGVAVGTGHSVMGSNHLCSNFHSKCVQICSSSSLTLYYFVPSVRRS